MDKKLKKEIKDNVRLLTRYKEQLMARHDNEPLKSPPVFLLNAVISNLEFLTEK
jgi:hypothetical protein